jgi:hypothetical protein
VKFKNNLLEGRGEQFPRPSAHQETTNEKLCHYNRRRIEARNQGVLQNHQYTPPARSPAITQDQQ